MKSNPGDGIVKQGIEVPGDGVMRTVTLKNDFGDQGTRQPYISAYDHHAAKNLEADHDSENCADCEAERREEDDQC